MEEQLQNRLLKLPDSEFRNIVAYVWGWLLANKNPRMVEEYQKAIERYLTNLSGA